MFYFGNLIIFVPKIEHKNLESKKYLQIRNLREILYRLRKKTMILKFRPFGCTKDHLICLSVWVHDDSGFEWCVNQGFSMNSSMKAERDAIVNLKVIVL